MSPHMLHTITHKTTSFGGHKSINLSTNLGTTLDVGFRVCHYDTFSKVLDIPSEWMASRKKLTMLVKR